METKLQALRSYQGPPLRLMELCGTHTHQLSRFGLPSILPPQITLIPGPGCPVCVTPAAYIDHCAALSQRPNATLLSYGDMLRVPGKQGSLQQAKALGASIALIYSPLDALTHAIQNPARTFYLTALGFETTLPLYALLLQRMAAQNIRNIRLIPALKALLPAMDWICSNPPMPHGFLGPGHVSAILGADAYAPLSARHKIPIVIAGFGYDHLTLALHELIRLAAHRTPRVRNLYPNAVSPGGNTQAQALIRQYFRPEDTLWRGLGPLPLSGYTLAPEYAHYLAPPYEEDASEPEGCRCGQVLTGQVLPTDCPMFGRECLPEHPVGPCMVSSEGACGIWFSTGRAGGRAFGDQLF